MSIQNHPRTRLVLVIDQNQVRKSSLSTRAKRAHRVAALVFAALTLFANVSFAQEAQEAQVEQLEPPDAADHAPDASDLAVATSEDELAADLANPTAPVMAMKSFLDLTYYRGDAPGAQKASFTYTFQPAFPFMTKGNKGNLIFRPLIPVQFGQPYINASGTVDTAVAFGNISLDSIFGKTFSNGLMVLGGVSTVFPTSSKPELRADWAFGPEAMLGHASRRLVFGVIVAYT